jgi:hypothetical protein
VDIQISPKVCILMSFFSFNDAPLITMSLVLQLFPLQCPPCTLYMTVWMINQLIVKESYFHCDTIKFSGKGCRYYSENVRDVMLIELLPQIGHFDSEDSRGNLLHMLVASRQGDSHISLPITTRVL